MKNNGKLALKYNDYTINVISGTFIILKDEKVIEAGIPTLQAAVDKVRELDKQKPNKMELKFDCVVAPIFNKKLIKKYIELGDDGDVLAKADLIMHNQLVIHQQLRQLKKDR